MIFLESEILESKIVDLELTVKINIKTHFDVLKKLIQNGCTPYLEIQKLQKNHQELFNNLVTDILYDACSTKNIDELNWWLKYSKENNLKIKCLESYMIVASCRGYINVLDWWVDCGFNPKFSDVALEFAIEYNHTTIVDWWKERLKFQSSQNQNTSVVISPRMR